MKATDWEFENRAWLFGMVFVVSFPLYYFDHQTSTLALANWIAARTQMNGDLVARLLFFAAAIVLILAAIIRTWASSYLHAEVVYAPEVKTASLVADGPYRHVRNPLYSANVLLAVGIGALMSRLGFVVAVAAMSAFCYRLILWEEVELQASQGENFARYRLSVPRLWPALRSRVPSSERKARWAEGFKAESWYWGFALASIVFAITLNVKWFFAIAAASIALLWVVSIMMSKRSKTVG